jgi:CubicO group peptidase (beta-lactamase class C family)
MMKRLSSALRFGLIIALGTSASVAVAQNDSAGSDAAALEANNPTLRALVVSRGDCVVFEYYRRDVSANALAPVMSITKSVLSILVGIAIDKGYLRLDEKLSEIAPEAFTKDVVPGVGSIAVRDLLTMTAGFTDEYVKIVSFPMPDTWKWILDGR